MMKFRPFADFIGITIHISSDGRAPTCTLKPSDKVARSATTMHGGAIAALLETAAGALVEHRLQGLSTEVQPVSITTDYIRPSLLVETYATAEVVRQGERIVHVDATAWQDDEERPVAMARLVFSLRKR